MPRHPRRRIAVLHAGARLVVQNRYTRWRCLVVSAAVVCVVLGPSELGLWAVGVLLGVCWRAWGR